MIYQIVLLIIGLDPNTIDMKRKQIELNALVEYCCEQELSDLSVGS